MTEYLIRLAQEHESFRQPELQALATLADIDLEFIFYDKHSPFCIVKLKDDAAARALITRSILAMSICELWGQGRDYDELHADIRKRTEHKWSNYRNSSFRFTIDGYGGGRRNVDETKMLISTFSYVGFQGPVKMKDPDQKFRIFEEYHIDLSDGTPESLDPGSNGVSTKTPEEESTKLPFMIYFGRQVARSSRNAVSNYDLKKRKYISTTSMESAMSLLTANMALAAPGKLFYDPFVGTGSFCVAAAHFGATGMGSDIDGRSYKGKEPNRNGKSTGLEANMEQYGHKSLFLDAFTADLTNTPIRDERLFDGIICDPPYGVREGLKVLGSRDGRHKGQVTVDGIPTHLAEGFIAPKRPYSFEAMLDDLLDFSARTLVQNGRLSFWMPTMNDELELGIPTHPCLEVVSVCIQPFNKWCRRLITYRRLPDGEISAPGLQKEKKGTNGRNANELNPFRRRYFEKSEAMKEQRNSSMQS